MTPKQLHDYCVAAASQCPQYPMKNWRYGDPAYGVKYSTLERVANYWLNDRTLWHYGYNVHLDGAASDFFSGLWKAKRKAVFDFCKEHEQR